MAEQPPNLDEFHALTENEELRRVVSDLQARLRRSETKTADLIEAVYRGAKDAAVVLGNPPAVKPPKPAKSTKSPEVGLLHVSDWQIGKVTESYNPDVAAARVDKLAEKVVKIAGIERADHPVNEIHVLLGGDMVEGVSIFPGQAFEIDGSLFKQMFQAVGCIERLLRTLLSDFERVHVWEEYGNHGRLGRKGDHPGEDSADLLVYRLAREKIVGYNERLSWHESQGWHSLVEIGNYRALLVHGDEVKSFGGQTPAFGIIKKVNGWASGVVEHFDDCYMGHFHQRMELPIARGYGCTFVNPSLESDNVYAAELMASGGTPGQRLNFVDPEKGRVSSERLIWLD